MKRFILWGILLLCFLVTGCRTMPSTESERKTLTLAVFASASRMSESKLIQWVNDYNENQSDVTIDIINYLDRYADPSEALNQIKIEIIAGKGPDMIDFGGQYTPLDATSGMLTDLYSFMQKDESFNKQDFYYNILQSFEVGEGLYVLVPSYAVDSFATVDRNLSGLERMSVRQLVNAWHMLDDESILFPGETKKAVLGMICYGSMENYIDWGAGICDFNGDSFKEILHFAYQFPLTLNIADDYSAKEIFTEGRALLYPVYMDHVYGTARVRMLYGKTPTYIGYPLDAGNGNMAAITDVAIGISGVSPNKEEAWLFLKSLLGSEYQDAIEKGLPVRISSLEHQLEAAMKTEYDAKGEEVVQERLIFDGEEPVNIYEISAEDAETLRSILRKIEYNATVDTALYSIMLEEADYLFHDNRNVDDVADIIQSRASIYVSESR